MTDAYMIESTGEPNSYVIVAPGPVVIARGCYANGQDTMMTWTSELDGTIGYGPAGLGSLLEAAGCRRVGVLWYLAPIATGGDEGTAHFYLVSASMLAGNIPTEQDPPIAFLGTTHGADLFRDVLRSLGGRVPAAILCATLDVTGRHLMFPFGAAPPPPPVGLPDGNLTWWVVTASYYLYTRAALLLYISTDHLNQAGIPAAI